MTSLDPSHIPSRGKDSRGQALYSLPTKPGRPRPVIPDLRFEQSFLKTISPYLQTRPIQSKDGANEKSEGGVEGEDGAVEVVGVQWGKVLWIVSRDQLMSPLVQGAVWCVILFPFPYSSHVDFSLSRNESQGCASALHSPTLIPHLVHPRL